MKRTLIRIVLAALTAGCGQPAVTAPATPTSVAPTEATNATITDENLYASERYWPYHVQLTGGWKPEGFEGEQFGWGVGVLVRVERSGDLRVDFGRFGRHLVPAHSTNVVEAANRIRTGAETKGTPNFVLAVVNKLADPTTDPIRYRTPGSVRDVKAFVIVAADPLAEGFPDLAASLEPLRDRPDVLLVLFPQGGHGDVEVVAACKQAGWTAPFAHSRFAGAFTDSIVDETLERPSLVVQSPEGRVIHAGVWSLETMPALVKSIETETRPQATSVADRDGDEIVDRAPPTT